MKNKVKKTRTTLSSAMPENSREKASHIPKMAQFLKGGENGHFAKAIAKQNGHEWS